MKYEIHAAATILKAPEYVAVVFAESEERAKMLLVLKCPDTCQNDWGTLFLGYTEDIEPPAQVVFACEAKIPR